MGNDTRRGFFGKLFAGAIFAPTISKAIASPCVESGCTCPRPMKSVFEICDWCKDTYEGYGQKTLAVTSAMPSVSRMSNCTSSCSSSPGVTGCCTPANVPTPLPTLNPYAKYDAQTGVPALTNPVTPWNIDNPPPTLLPQPTVYAKQLYQAWLAQNPP